MVNWRAAGPPLRDIGMVQVLRVDHLVIRVSDYQRSKNFYNRLFGFFEFEIISDFSDTVGWRNGATAFWIMSADAAATNRRLREGDVGLHHYAFELASRSDVDELEAFLKVNDIDITDPAAEYYQDYYAVYFLDPDGIKLEGMTYGPAYPHGARKKG
jgi:catechol 2,3-dioxygenase-like lactoylglutathione lyase family enzyme